MKLSEIKNGNLSAEWAEKGYELPKFDVEAVKAKTHAELESLEAFEIEYFNTGTEWIIDDGEFDPENDSPLNINGCSVYCTSGSEEGIRKEIADAEGFDPADVVLYAFEGWSRTAQYEEVV